MIWIIKYFLLKLLLCVLKIFWAFPIKRNSIVFMSYYGKQISCNPLYIYKYMKVDPRFCCTWIVQKKQESDIPYNQQVRVKSLQSIYTFIRAKVIVTNTEVPSYIPYRSNQIIINTWHGGGAFKKISQKNFGKAKWYEDKITDNDGASLKRLF